MPDSKFLKSQTARSRCAAGQFVLMGRTLRAFSLAHLSVLDELIGADVWDSTPDAPTLDIISRVCTQREPGTILDPMTTEERDRYAHSLMQFDIDAERVTWVAYMDLCALSRPRTRMRTDGSLLDLRAPYALLVVTYILRHMHGVTHDELLHDWPLAKVLWQYESLREQIGEVSYFADSDEPDPEPTPEETESQKRHDALAARILEQADSAHAKATTPAEHQAADAEMSRLLALALEGRLTDDLTEIPENKAE